MNAKRIFVLFGKVIILTILGFLTTAVAGLITPSPEFLKTTTGSANGQEAAILFLVKFILAVIFVFILESSKLRGIRLAGFLFWVVFGVTTFVMQLETIIFGSAFPMLSTNDVFKMVFTNLVGDLLFVPLAVLLTGKWKGESIPMGRMLPKNFLPGIILLAIAYPVLYFFFGFVVAWQFSAVREFYASTSITNSQFILAVIQVGRGALWVFAGLPLFSMFKKKSHAIISSILCYSLFPSIALLLPNPLMPEPVRMAHLVEISLSMAIFGLLASRVMTSDTFGIKRGFSKTIDQTT